MSKNLCGKEIVNPDILTLNVETILRRIRNLGIPELAALQTLNLLNGDYINLDVLLPNGSKAKLLDDRKTYYANQVEKTGTGHCYGVAADEAQIAVYEYGPEGADPVLVHWLRYC